MIIYSAYVTEVIFFSVCRKLKVISTSVLLFLRLIASFIVAAYDGWLRRKCEIIGRFRERLKLQLFSLMPTNFVTSLMGN